MTNTNLSIEHIVWKDAGSCLSSWARLDRVTDEDLDLHICDSVGYVVRENDDVLLIAQSAARTADGENIKVVDGLRIIKSNIVSRVTLVPSPLEQGQEDKRCEHGIVPMLCPRCYG